MNADGNSNGYLYYRCYGKKNMNESCKKRNMEKNLIERLVAQDAMSFLTDEYIEKIATIACDRNRQEIESDSPIPVIRDRIRQVDVSLNNLLKAIETGSAPDMLVKRMGELETEKKDMEVQLKKEMAHQVYIEKEQVIFWLEKFREGDINDEEFCQTVIDLFVNSVTVWDEPDDKFLHLDHLRLIEFKEHQLIASLLHKLTTEAVFQIFVPLHNVKKSLCQSSAPKGICTPASFFQSAPADCIRIALFARPNGNTSVN